MFEGPDILFGADGRDTSQVKHELARCNVSTIFSNQYSHAALCSDRTVVVWGYSRGTALFCAGWRAWASRMMGRAAHWVQARVAAGAFGLDQGAGRCMGGLSWRRLGHEGRLCLKDLTLWLVQGAGTRAKSRTSLLGAMCQQSSRIGTRMLHCAATARSLPGETATVRRFLVWDGMHWQAE